MAGSVCRLSSWLLAALLFFPLLSTDGLDTCSFARDEVTLTPSADVFIGAFLQIHERGRGILGCGKPSAEGIEIYEAVNWAVSLLNKDSGFINGVEVSQSFIPGVKIGLKVYDSCGHDSKAAHQVTELFPVLKDGLGKCSSGENSTVIGSLYVDHVIQNPKVAELMRENFIPNIPVSGSSVVPPDYLAKTILEAAFDMKWDRVVLLHATNEYSLSVAKALSQKAQEGKPCIAEIEAIPEDQDSNSSEQNPSRKLLRDLASKLPDNIGIIVVGEGRDVHSLIKAMSELPDITNKFQWLFSWVPGGEVLNTLGDRLNSRRTYSLSPYPPEIGYFEEYWKKIPDISSIEKIEDHWFLEYVMEKKNCRIQGYPNNPRKSGPVCSNLALQESPADVLVRSSRVVSALRGVFTIAYAFKKAWEVKCQGIAGYCQNLKLMSKKEFVNQYLDPFDAERALDHGRPSSAEARKAPESILGDLEDRKLALTVFSHDRNLGASFSQLILYDSAEAKLLDRRAVFLPSVCTAHECHDCIRFRTSRLEHAPLQSSSNAVFVDSSADFILPLILPIHQKGLSPSQCGDTINPNTIQNLEAALWMIDRINSDSNILPGIKLGAAILDTCFSSLKVTKEVSSFLQTSESGAPAVFVSSVSPEETSTATALLSQLNITLVSAVDSVSNSKKLGMDQYQFQISVPIEKVSRAMYEVVTHLGWEYISIIHSEDRFSRRGYESFKSYAKDSGMCVAFDRSMISHDRTVVDQLIVDLISAKHQGASVVALWLNDEDASHFFQGVKRAYDVGVLKSGELVWLFGGNLNSVKGVEKEAQGAVLFQAKHGEVREFISYFKRLRPDTSIRNRYFEEFWEQHRLCQDEQCKTSIVNYIPDPAVADIMQAVLSVASSITMLQKEYCGPEKGLCPGLLRHPNLLPLISNRISESSTLKPDNKQEVFSFTKDGFGDTPVEIWNIRKATATSVTTQKAGSYKDTLTHLINLVTYNEYGQEVVLNHIQSECISKCHHCTKTSPDFVLLSSSDNIYLTATFGVHTKGESSFECGPLLPRKGLQNLEAFLWAVDQINISPDILPNTKLGAIVFDTCGSREKTYRDVSNFFSHTLRTLSDNITIPTTEQVYGVVAGFSQDTVQPVADIAAPLKITTLAPHATSSIFGNLEKYPYLLRLSLPNSLLASSIVELTKHFRWSYVSVVYSDEDHYTDLYEQFMKQSKSAKVKFALIEKISSSKSDSAGILTSVMNRLKIKETAGARVVILLLNENHLQGLFSAARDMVSAGTLKPGDMIWVTTDHLETLGQFPDVAMGAITITPSMVQVPGFKEHFQSLSIRNNQRNPWFKEFWEHVFNCRGAACQSGLNHDLQKIPFEQDASIAMTVSSVFAVASGIDRVRRSLCTSDAGVCDEMKSNPLAREHIFNITKKVHITSPDGTTLEFTPDNYGTGHFDVLSFHQIDSNNKAFISIGYYTEAAGLNINTTQVKGYLTKDGQETDLYNIISECEVSDDCPAKPAPHPEEVMQISPLQEFAIGAVLPVHQYGKNIFSCGSLREERIFQNLAAIAFAINSINSNNSLLPHIKLGTVVFDYCSSKQRAEERLYHYFASEERQENEISVKPKSILSLLSFEEEVAHEISPILKASSIPLVLSSINPATPSPSDNPMSLPLRTVPAEQRQIDAILDLLKQYDWKYVYVLYSQTEFGMESSYYFSTAAEENHICIAESEKIASDATESDIINSIMKFRNPDIRVIVVISEDKVYVKSILSAAKKASVLEKFVWIGTEGMSNNNAVVDLIDGASVDIFSVNLQNMDIPDFRRYYSSLNLGKHEPIPDSWFEEFWQHNFQCQLPSSAVIQPQYSDICTGQESLKENQIMQDRYVYHTVESIKLIARGLHDYLNNGCMYGSAALSIENCGKNAREDLNKAINLALIGQNPGDCEECQPVWSTTFGFQVLKLNGSSGNYTYLEVGSFKNDMLSLQNDAVDFATGLPPMSVCMQDCDKCKPIAQDNYLNLIQHHESINANFKTVWGIVVTALSLLGIVLVIICAFYFLMAFPVTIGTTILGYMILFGLLILYAVNFAFIVGSTESSCGIRRFVMGLAYSVIFSGMLVKVMNTWRLMGYNGNRMMHDGTRLTSPAGLLVIACGLVIIQIVLTAAWLILMPPKIGFYNKVWRCAPPASFEDELVVSMVYVMLLLAITILFSILTWKCQDNNKESRWILACCVFVSIVWLAWTVLSTQLPLQYRDATIVAANLLCATIVMLCLYLRKVYLYNKLARQARDQELKAKLQPPHYTASVYGTLHKGPVPPIFYGSQMSLSAKKMNGTFSRLSLDDLASDGARSTSSGSVQVQGTDLYPLEMYDGGSQFQPVNSLYGSMMMLDDSVTFSR